jgi:hypothetical protein
MLEVWVHACLLSGDSSCRVVFKERVQEVKAIFIQARNKCPAFFTLPLGESRLVVGERGDAWPGVLVRCTKKSDVEESS